MQTKIHILLAEDEPPLGMIVKENLESKGFSVELCENGEIALNTYHQKYLSSKKARHFNLRRYDAYKRRLHFS